jgi:3-isopropylmalate/(R)-2-methylmalate dehydratase large subunit
MAAGVEAKDLVLHVIGKLGADGALYMSVEWHGDTIEGLDLAQRAVLTNMTAEMGAKNSYIPADGKVFDYLEGRAKRSYDPSYPDPDAHYAQIVEYDVSAIEPMVACPHTVDNVKSLSEVAGKHIDQAFLGTCTNGRLRDLAAAAAVFQGRRIASGTRMIVIPASSHVYSAALRAGYIETLVAAGAIVESPGCGPCVGNHMGIPAEGEVVISSANRNFQGRMGTKESEIYLSSPAVVAASAVAGVITHPKQL